MPSVHVFCILTILVVFISIPLLTLVDYMKQLGTLLLILSPLNISFFSSYDESYILIYYYAVIEYFRN